MVPPNGFVVVEGVRAALSGRTRLVLLRVAAGAVPLGNTGVQAVLSAATAHRLGVPLSVLHY